MNHVQTSFSVQRTRAIVEHIMYIVLASVNLARDFLKLAALYTSQVNVLLRL